MPPTKREKSAICPCAEVGSARLTMIRQIYQKLDRKEAPHKGNFSHEVGKIKGLRAGMTGMVTTVWEAETDGGTMQALR